MSLNLIKKQTNVNKKTYNIYIYIWEIRRNTGKKGRKPTFDFGDIWFKHNKKKNVYKSSEVNEEKTEISLV